MLLKTNKRVDDGVLLARYDIENKSLSGTTRRIKSIRVNIKQINAKSTADARQMTHLTSVKCDKYGLEANFDGFYGVFNQ
jgi:hypothetical protein